MLEKLHKRAFLSMFFAATSLSGCGGSSNESGNQGLTVAVNGVVQDKNGQRLQNITLRWENRETGEPVIGTTGSDGTYQVQLPFGVYDVQLDDGKVGGVDASFFGPVTVSANLQRNFALENDGGAPPGQISGHIYVTEGVPLVNRKLRFISETAISHNSQNPATVPDDVETTTDANGFFKVSLETDQEIGTNLEIYDENGQLEEFVDMIKPAGEMSVNLLTNSSPVKNATRASDEARYLASIQAPDPSGLNSPPASSSGQDDIRPFNIRSKLDNLPEYGARLEDGYVPAFSYSPVNGRDAQYFRWAKTSNLKILSSVSKIYSLLTMPVSVNRWVDNVQVAGLELPGFTVVDYGQKDSRGRYFIELLTSKAGDFRFFDVSGASYELRANGPGLHSVYYDSTNPAITMVEAAVRLVGPKLR